MTDEPERPTKPMTWIPFVLIECSDCSALLRDDSAARANHERWHAMFPLPKAGAVPRREDE
jgi:hypothetical protein